jgi:hypothetical protein
MSQEEFEKAFRQALEDLDDPEVVRMLISIQGE